MFQILHPLPHAAAQCAVHCIIHHKIYVMKPLCRSFLRFLSAGYLLLYAVAIQAQEEKVTTTTTKTHVQIQPWMWAVGGALFILILVAILKGSNKKNG